MKTILMLIVITMNIFSSSAQTDKVKENLKYFHDYKQYIPKTKLQGIEDSVKSEYHYKWDFQSGTWQNYSLKWYFYGSNNRDSLNLFYLLGSDDSELQTKEIYIYDDNGNLLYDSLYMNDNFGNVNLKKLWSHNFDENNNLRWETTKYYLMNGWKIADSIYYFYDYNNRIKETNAFLWDIETDTAFFPYGVYRTFYYNDIQNKIDTLVTQSFKDGSWLNRTKSIKIYNENGLLIELIVQNWSNGEWFNEDKEVRKYDSLNNDIYHGYQYWNGDEWQTYTDYDYLNVYDNDGNLIEILNKGVEYYFKYDNQNRLIESIRKDAIYGKMDNKEKIIYDYEKYLDLPDKTDVKPQVKNDYFIYPNPAENLFNLEFDLIINNNTVIDLVDLSGNIVKMIENQFLSVGHYTYNVNINDLPSGIYTLRILSGNFSFNSSIIKIK